MVDTRALAEPNGIPDLSKVTMELSDMGHKYEGYLRLYPESSST